MWEFWYLRFQLPINSDGRESQMDGKGCLLSNKKLDVVLQDFRIVRHKRQFFDLALCDKQTIERVAMMNWKDAYLKGMVHRDVESLKRL